MADAPILSPGLDAPAPIAVMRGGKGRNKATTTRSQCVSVGVVRRSWCILTSNKRSQCVSVGVVSVGVVRRSWCILTKGVNIYPY